MINSLNTCWIRIHDRYIKISSAHAIRYDYLNHSTHLYESGGYVSVVKTTQEEFKTLCSTVGLTDENVLLEFGNKDGENSI